MFHAPTDKLRRNRYTIASFLLLIIVMIVLAHSAKTPKQPVPQNDLLELLPAPEQGSPAAIITALRGEFPQDLARLLSTNVAPPDKIPAAAAFMPMFDASEAMALVVTERASGLSIYGVFTPTLEEYDALRSGALPDEWKKNFVSPVLRQTDRRNLYQMTDGNDAQLYVMAEDDLIYVTDAAADINRIIDVRNGVTGGIGRKWSIDPERGGHAYLSDGGLISAMIKGPGISPNLKESLELEAAWVSSGDSHATHAKWQVSGTEHLVARTFLNDLKPSDWSKSDSFIPDPLVLSFGINLPNPGRSMSNLPYPLKYAAETLRELGLRASDVQALLTGQITFSLGGRTQLLWFDLPGIAIDIPGRGDAGFRLIDKFWSETFAGTEPGPIAGYSRGGVTDLPFTALAAANEEKAILGLVTPDADQNYEVRDLLSNATAAAAWIYVDFPRFGASLLEIPALNSMIYEDGEENALDEESAGKLNNALSALGRVFVMWESAASGSAICYY